MNKYQVAQPWMHTANCHGTHGGPNQKHRRRWCCTWRTGIFWRLARWPRPSAGTPKRRVGVFPRCRVLNRPASFSKRQLEADGYFSEFPNPMSQPHRSTPFQSKKSLGLAKGHVSVALCCRWGGGFCHPLRCSCGRVGLALSRPLSSQSHFQVPFKVPQAGRKSQSASPVLPTSQCLGL